MNLRGAGISGIDRPHFSVPLFWHGIFISTEWRLMKSRGPSRQGKAISSIMREFFRPIYNECEQRGKRRLNTREQKCTLARSVFFTHIEERDHYGFHFSRRR